MESPAGDNIMGEFRGSILILIVLLIVFWPAAIIYLLLKWELRPTYPTTPNTYPSTPCAYCGKGVYLTYSNCTYCGKPTGFSTHHQGPPFGYKACPHCKATINGTDMFCRYCGERV
jgi:hypothetical protein